MLVVNENVKLIAQDLVDKLGSFQVSVLADAIGALKDNRNAVLGDKIHGVKAGLKFAGVAVTVKAPDGNLFPIQYALYKGYPGAVLCIDTGKHMENPYLGEMMAFTARGFGYKAIVIDGLIRDKAEIMDMDYPVFALGTHPMPKAPSVGGEINVEINLDGAAVHPGDFIAGDDDGMVVITPACAADILAIAETKAQADAQRLENIKKFFAAPVESRDIYSTMGPGFAKQYKLLEDK